MALKHIGTNNNMNKLKGGQKTTWIKNLEKDLNKLKLHPQESTTELTQDRSAWRKRCCAVLIPAPEVTAPPMSMVAFILSLIAECSRYTEKTLQF